MVCPKTGYEEEVRRHAQGFGGFFNAHAHGDRAFTYEDVYYTHIATSVSDIERLSLPEKQALVWALHTGSAFQSECLEQRMEGLLRDSIRFGVTRLDTAIDVTYNTQLKSLEVAERLKQRFSGEIDLRLGAYNVAGFRDSKPERFELFEEAAKRTDFLVALAEKDGKDGHIGEEQHNHYMLNLGLRFGIPVQFHVGQANHPKDRGAELLFQNMHEVYDKTHRLGEYPRNWLVHDISAACYNTDDFERHCEEIKRFNLGVICCPTAAISMKQDRNTQAPIHNSIARIWDYALRKIPVLLGTDNINDVFVPSSTPDLYDEALVLSHAGRFYNPRILAKIASGTELDDFDRGKIERAMQPRG
jgi:cytosine/adenosine deaminase-related metal-dependent hydrolase